ncbi:MAG TPA: ABC transporter substrate-binding protein [Polyangiaceae bacterium]|nr:ABC transporter substrate-binding protein [Polyangiaceae bacterium]
MHERAGIKASAAKKKVSRLSSTLKVARVALTQALAEVDPRQGLDYVNVFFWEWVYETPFAPGGGGRVAPGLLQFPESSDEALIASVTPGKFFSDGTPVSAALIVDSLNRCEAFKQYASADANSGRVVLRPRRPGAGFTQQLVGMHYLVGKNGSDGRLLGTGPYRFASDSTSSRPHLVRNEHVPNEKGPDEIWGTLWAVGSGDSRQLIDALQRGDLDYCDALSAADARGLNDFRCISTIPDATAFLFFNVAAPGLWVRDARAALAKAVNCQAYARAVFGEERAAAVGLLAPLFGIAAPGRHRFDPARGAAELRALKPRAALRTPLRMLMPGASRPHTPNVRAASETLVKMLRVIGVAVEPILPASTAEFARIAEAGTYDLAVSGWNPESLVASDVLEAVLASTSIPRPTRSVANCSNLARFGNIELDLALAKAANSGSVSDIAAVQELVDQHVPLVPLACGGRTVVVRRGLELPSRSESRLL